MKLVPLYNKIIVEVLPEEDESTTSSGLILLSKKNPYLRGKVIGVGEGSYQNAKRIPLDVKEGDVLLFLKNSGMGVEFDDAGHTLKIILADIDVYAKIEK